MADLTLTGLRVVREVATTGSFTAAAEVLGYTQSAVSRQVALMEAATGAVLFERGARGVSPTPAGLVLVRRAAALLAGVEAAEVELAGLRDRLAGRLVVGSFPTAAAVLVPRALARLHERHPGLVTSLEEGSSPALLRQVRAGRVEVAVIGVGQGLPEHDLSGLTRDLLVEDDLRVAVPQDHRLAGQAQVGVDDLAGEVWVVGRGGRDDPQFGAWPTLADPRIGHAVRNWPTRLGMVAAGLGISLLPGVAADSAPAGVRVLRVVDEHWLGRAAVVVAPADRSRSATAMVGALKAQAASSHPRPGAGRPQEDRAGRQAPAGESRSLRPMRA